jgi:hypothetical protein
MSLIKLSQTGNCTFGIPDFLKFLAPSENLPKTELFLTRKSKPSYCEKYSRSGRV